MTVSTQQVFNNYNGDGVAKQFAYKFLIYEEGDIIAEVDGVPVTPASITGIGTTLGGDVIFSTPPANGARVVIRRAMPLARATDYQENGDWIASTINRDFDRLWMALQDFTANTSTALSHPLGGLDYDAQGHRIYNVSAPRDDNDAVNKDYVDTLFTDTAASVLKLATQYRDAAQQAAHDAQQAASGVNSGVTAAAKSAEDAAKDRQQVGTWRAEIEIWHTDISGWHTEMSGWLSAAQQQATNAAASAKAASDAIAPISSQINAAAQSASDAAGSANAAAGSASTAQQHRQAAAQSAQAAADKLTDIQHLATSFDVSNLLNVSDFPVDFAKALVLNFAVNAGSLQLKYALDVNNKRLMNLPDPRSAQEAATKKYVDDTISGITVDTTNLISTSDLSRDTAKALEGAFRTGSSASELAADKPLNMSGYQIQNVKTPTEDTDGANKKYVDDAISSVGGDGGAITIDEDKAIDGKLINIKNSLDGVIPLISSAGRVINFGEDGYDLNIDFTNINSSNISADKITVSNAPVDALDLTNKEYVDNAIHTAVGKSGPTQNADFSGFNLGVLESFWNFGTGNLYFDIPGGINPTDTIEVLSTINSPQNDVGFQRIIQMNTGSIYTRSIQNKSWTAWVKN